MKKKDQPGKLPKGAYRLPTGGYVTTGKWSPPDHRGQRIRTVAVHRDPPDIKKLARAFLQLAEQEAEARSDRRRRRL